MEPKRVLPGTKKVILLGQLKIPFGTLFSKIVVYLKISYHSHSSSSALTRKQICVVHCPYTEGQHHTSLDVDSTHTDSMISTCS
jgi:hypothetical protein